MVGVVAPVLHIIPVGGFEVNTSIFPGQIPAGPLREIVGVVTGLVVNVAITGIIFVQPSELVAVKLMVEVAATELDVGV